MMNSAKKPVLTRPMARLWLGVQVMVVGVGVAGCGGKGAEVREYREVRVEPEAQVPRASPHGARPSAMPAPTPVVPVALAWSAPEGWAESTGSGMRLVSFAVGAGEEGLCTLITLTGPAGGLEANVARWLGQLELPVPEGEAYLAFLEAQERFETDSGLPVVLVDLVPLSREEGAGDDSMMVGVVSFGRQTGFLKFTGPLALLEREKEHLRALCRSVRVAS